MIEATDASALCCKEAASLWHGLPRHCTTHSCEIIPSKCTNMQNRPYNGLELKCINDYDIPNSPCAAQPTELCCPNSSKGPARNSFSVTEEGEAKSMLHCNLLSAHIHPPDNSWTWTEVEGERVRFFISTGRQQEISSHSAASYTSNTPCRPPHPPKTHALSVCLQTQHLYMHVKHSHTDSMRGDLKEKYVFLHILYVPLVFPFHSALSIKNILTQKPVSIKVSIPRTFKDKPYLITSALTTEI